jgi:CHAD domain-containing protein
LRELEDHARALGRCVGELRDADVLIEEMFAPVADTVDDEGGLARVREAILAHRVEARAHARQGLSGGPWSALQLYLALWPHAVEDAGRLGGSLVRFAPSAIKRQWKRVADRGVRLAALTLEERHEMRKALKGLRYTCEFFLSLYPEDKADRFLNRSAPCKTCSAISTTSLPLGASPRSARQRAAKRSVWRPTSWAGTAQASHAWKEAHNGWEKLERLAHFWE